MFVCLFNLIYSFSFCLLSTDWKVIIPLNCWVCPPWVGFDQCLLKASLLQGLVPLFLWMELDLVSLKGLVMSSSMFWGVYELGIALGSMPANGQECVSVLFIIFKFAFLFAVLIGWFPFFYLSDFLHILLLCLFLPLNCLFLIGCLHFYFLIKVII